MAHKADSISIEELIITLISKEPIVYNKALETKLNVVTARKNVFEVVSQAIFSIYGVEMPGKKLSVQVMFFH